MYGQTNANDAQGVATLENRVSALETGVSSLTKYEAIAVGTTASSINDALGKAWDGISPAHTVIGTFKFQGDWMFMGYKYTGEQYGMMFAMRYDGVQRLMTVTGGTKSFKFINTTDA